MNCLPVVEAGQALLVDDDYALDDTAWLTPTPGHSPCHCCVNIRSRGQRAVVTGDMMHHALQCREPDWSTVFDTGDPLLAAKSRRSFLASVVDTDTLVLPVHFPAPTVGRVAADGSRFLYRFRGGADLVSLGSSPPPRPSAPQGGGGSAIRARYRMSGRGADFPPLHPGYRGAGVGVSHIRGATVRRSGSPYGTCSTRCTKIPGVWI